MVQSLRSCVYARRGGWTQGSVDAGGDGGDGHGGLASFRSFVLSFLACGNATRGGHQEHRMTVRFQMPKLHRHRPQRSFRLLRLSCPAQK